MNKSNEYNANLPKDRSVYDAQCPIIYTIDVIGGKWKLPVLWHLSVNGPVRFNELKRQVIGVTNVMLSKCLKELEEAELVSRVQYNEIPPRVEYALTKRGKELLPALQNLYEWGKEQLAKKV